MFAHGQKDTAMKLRLYKLAFTVVAVVAFAVAAGAPHKI